MPNENKCVQCDITFETKGDLKTHMHQQHDVTKSHTCNQCGYQANSASKLKSHMLVHSGEKPFICKQCNYSFTQAGNLKRHMLTHAGVKAFNCKQCNYSSTQAGDLKRHIRTHSGKKAVQLQPMYLFLHNV